MMWIKIVLVIICNQCLFSTADVEEFLVVNDIHYDFTYDGRQESCVTHLDEPLPKYSPDDCEPNWELVKSTVDNLKQRVPNPKFIVWLGDNTHHFRNGSDTLLTEAMVVEVIHNITQLLQDNFPDTPVLPVLGNHDYLPKNENPVLPPGERDVIMDGLTELWGTWIQDEGGDNHFHDAGYYKQTISGDLVAVVLNNNLYSTWNQGTVGLADPGGQYAWTRTTLQAARDNRQKVLLIIHSPIGFSEWSGRMYLRDEDNEEMLAIIRNHSDIIIGIFSGHAHTDAFKVIYSEESTPIAVNFVCPAVNPWRSFWGSPPARNPAFRAVSYDSGTGHLLDINTYYLKLDEANANSSLEAVWLEEYSFRSSYNLTSLSPSQFHQLLGKIKEFGGDFNRYFTYNTVSANEDSCSCECRGVHVCSIQEVQRAGHEQCVEQHNAKCDATSTTLSVMALLPFIMARLLW